MVKIHTRAQMVWKSSLKTSASSQKWKPVGSGFAKWICTCKLSLKWVCSVTTRLLAIAKLWRTTVSAWVRFMSRRTTKLSKLKQRTSQTSMHNACGMWIALDISGLCRKSAYRSIWSAKTSEKRVNCVQSSAIDWDKYLSCLHPLWKVVRQWQLTYGGWKVGLQGVQTHFILTISIFAYSVGNSLVLMFYLYKVLEMGQEKSFQAFIPSKSMSWQFTMALQKNHISEFAVRFVCPS